MWLAICLPEPDIEGGRAHEPGPRPDRERGELEPAGRGKTILQVVWSTDLYLALNHRERHHSSEASLAARWQVTHSRRI